MAHVPGAAVGGSYFGSGAGRAFSSSAIFGTNDSLLLSLDVYAALSQAWALSRERRIRSGEPLGTGGCISKVYNTYLYRRFPCEKPFPFRADMRQGHSDMGYVPLWPPEGMSARLRHRFLPNLWGTLTLDFNVDHSKASVRSVSSPLQVGELSFKWRPRGFDAVALSFGRVHIAGSYAWIFDQMPLDNFRLNGMAATWSGSSKSAGSVKADLALGSRFLGRTAHLSDTLANRYNIFGILNSIRTRNVVLGRLRYNAPRRLSCELSGSYQSTAEDSTESWYAGASQVEIERRLLPATSGWHLGGEVMYGTKRTNHSAVLCYARGAVETAWGSPDFVNATSLDTVHYWRENRAPEFSREGSGLVYGVYWGDLRLNRFSLGAGVWGSWSIPSKEPVIYVLDTTFYTLRQDDYVVKEAHLDTAELRAEDFRAVKWALEPSVRPVCGLRAGLRCDGMYYHDSDARSNVPDSKRADFAMQPLYSYSAVALWDEEAVNAYLVTPFVECDIVNTLRIRASYTRAFYEEPVYRQARLSRRHQNLTVSAVLTYRFARLGE